jgi:hypothetical protein
MEATAKRDRKRSSDPPPCPSGGLGAQPPEVRSFPPGPVAAARSFAGLRSSGGRCSPPGKHRCAVTGSAYDDGTDLRMGPYYHRSRVPPLTFRGPGALLVLEHPPPCQRGSAYWLPPTGCEFRVSKSEMVCEWRGSRSCEALGQSSEDERKRPPMGRKSRRSMSRAWHAPEAPRGSLRVVPGLFLDGEPVVVVRVTCDDPACGGKCL